MPSYRSYFLEREYRRSSYIMTNYPLVNALIALTPFKKATKNGKQKTKKK